MRRGDFDWGKPATARPITEEQLKLFGVNQVFDGGRLIVATTHDGNTLVYRFAVKRPLLGSQWHELPSAHGDDGDMVLLRDSIFDLIQESVSLGGPHPYRDDGIGGWVLYDDAGYIVVYHGTRDLAHGWPAVEDRCVVYERRPEGLVSLMKDYTRVWQLAQHLVSRYRELEPTVLSEEDL